MALPAARRKFSPESSHHWRGRDYTIPAQGIVRVYKPEGFHREQVFSYAINELRQLVEEMFAED